MTAESMVSIRGWLRQKPSPLKPDKRCYCVLSDNTLNLFADERDVPEKPVESVRVEEILEVRPVTTCSQPSFQIYLRGNVTQMFLCSSMSECERWMCALSHQAPVEHVSIDSFELLSVIGRGTFGKVFLARKRHTENLYAVKAIRKDQVKEHARESRIIAERNILMRASHQFLTRLYYAFQTPSKFYFVLEYVCGGDLQHHLERGVEFSAYQIRLYLAEIVIALKTLHKLGVVYRDLKPENILLDKNGHIKLADFGLSRIVDQGQKFSLCGTCEFLAPEMLNEQPQSFCVDWWALGVLAFRLMVGYLPFRSANMQRLYDMILHSDPRIPQSVDPAAASFVRGLLSKNPATRLGSPGTDITAHEYFAGLSWPDVAKYGYQSEFHPVVSRENSVSNFDEEFTNEPVTDSFVEPESVIEVRGFSFQNDMTFTKLDSFDDSGGFGF